MQIQSINSYSYNSFTSNDKHKNNNNNINSQKFATIVGVCIAPVLLSSITLFCSGRYKNIPKENRFKNTLIALKKELSTILDCI